MSADTTTIHAEAGATKIVVSGSINERSQLLVPEPATVGSRIVVDTSAVTRINSLGVASWMRYMRELSKLGVPVSIAPLAVALVTQASMIANFLGGASVETFQAPYFCDKCDRSIEQPFAIDADVPESIACPSCSAPMEFDDELESFLNFRI